MNTISQPIQATVFCQPGNKWEVIALERPFCPKCGKGFTPEAGFCAATLDCQNCGVKLLFRRERVLGVDVIGVRRAEPEETK